MSGKFWDKGIQLVDGCNKVSSGCLNCWAEAFTARFKRVPEVLTDNKFNGKVVFNLRLLEKAVKARKSQVFAIWNDLYHKDVTNEQIRQAFYIMDHRPFDTFLIVTKRPERFTEVFFIDMKGWKLPQNIWHIVTTENQECFDSRIHSLLDIPGKRGIIIEPMLDEIDLSGYINDCMCGECDYCLDTCENPTGNEIHQVILGAETGLGARPFDPAWAFGIRDQCAAADIPFYFKSMGTGKGRELDGKTHNDLAWVKK